MDPGNEAPAFFGFWHDGRLEAEGGEERGYDAGKKVTGANGTWLWTRWAWCGRSSCMEPIGRTMTELALC